MEHKELIDDSVAPIVDETETPSNAVTTYMHAESSITLNIHEGMAGTVLDRIITERARSSQAKKAADERKRKGDSIMQNLKEAEKLTSGVMASNGIHSLSDPRFLQAYTEKRRAATEKLDRNATAKRTNIMK